MTLLAAVLGVAVVVGEVILLVLHRLQPSDALVFTAIMLPFMVCICQVALLAGAYNALGRFGTPALMPILFNVLFILCVSVAVRHAADLRSAAHYLAVGVVLVVQAFLVSRIVRRVGVGPALSSAGARVRE